jgi:hypothetical protein
MKTSVGNSSSRAADRKVISKVHLARSKVYDGTVPAVTMGDGRTKASIAREPFSRRVLWGNVNARSTGMDSSPWRVLSWTVSWRRYGSLGSCLMLTTRSLSKGVGGVGDSSSLLQMARSSPSQRSPHSWEFWGGQIAVRIGTTFEQ